MDDRGLLLRSNKTETASIKFQAGIRNHMFLCLNQQITGSVETRRFRLVILISTLTITMA